MFLSRGQPSPDARYRIRNDGSIHFTKHTSTTPVPESMNDSVPYHRSVPSASPAAASLAANKSVALLRTPEPLVRRGTGGAPTVSPVPPTLDGSVFSGPLASASPPLLTDDVELANIAAGRQHPTGALPRLKLPSHMLTTRDSVALLEASLDQRLAAIKKEAAQEDLSRHDAAVAVHAVIGDVAHELTRQVAASCAERGRLLARVWLHYTEVVNALTEAWNTEHHRHTVAEAQSNKQLQQARVDYATMVTHSETILRESHERLAKAEVERERKEAELTALLEETRDNLRKLQAMVRRVKRNGNWIDDDPSASTSVSLMSETQQITRLRADLLEAQVANRNLSEKVQAQEIKIVDAHVEIARLKDFLRGGVGSGISTKDAVPEKAHAYINTDLTIPPSANVAVDEQTVEPTASADDVTERASEAGTTRTRSMTTANNSPLLPSSNL